MKDEFTFNIHLKIPTLTSVHWVNCFVFYQHFSVLMYWRCIIFSVTFTLCYNWYIIDVFIIVCFLFLYLLRYVCYSICFCICNCISDPAYYHLMRNISLLQAEDQIIFPVTSLILFLWNKDGWYNHMIFINSATKLFASNPKARSRMTTFTT